MQNSVVIRRMREGDVLAVADIHRNSFPRQIYSKEWIECSYRAFPLTQCFVAEYGGTIVGFVSWTEKGGFKKEALVELEQGAVEPAFQSNGICTKLVLESLPMVANQITTRGATIKNIIVNTRIDNVSALRICRSVLGAELVATIAGIFTADEVYFVVGSEEKVISIGERSPTSTVL